MGRSAGDVGRQAATPTPWHELPLPPSDFGRDVRDVRLRILRLLAADARPEARAALRDLSRYWALMNELRNGLRQTPAADGQLRRLLDAFGRRDTAAIRTVAEAREVWKSLEQWIPTAWQRNQKSAWLGSPFMTLVALDALERARDWGDDLAEQVPHLCDLLGRSVDDD